MLLTYSLLPRARYDSFRKAIILGSAGIVWFFIADLYTNSIAFPAPLDLFFGVQGVTFALIATLGFERPKAVQTFAPRMVWLESLLAKTKRLRVPALPSTHKPA
jgi:hypothetical protein